MKKFALDKFSNEIASKRRSLAISYTMKRRRKYIDINVCIALSDWLQIPLTDFIIDK